MNDISKKWFNGSVTETIKKKKTSYWIEFYWRNNIPLKNASKCLGKGRFQPVLVIVVLLSKDADRWLQRRYNKFVPNSVNPSLWPLELRKQRVFFFSFSAQFAESIERGDNKGHRDKVPLYQCAGAHSKFALNADWPELTLPTIGTHQSLPERVFLLNAALQRIAAAYLSCRSDFSTSG